MNWWYRSVKKDHICYWKWSMIRGGFRGGHIRHAPPLFFAEIRRLTLCGCPRQKECTKSCKLTLKIAIFLRFWGGTSPSDTPLSPQAPKFCKPLMWAPPLLKNPGSAPDDTTDLYSIRVEGMMPRIITKCPVRHNCHRKSETKQNKRKQNRKASTPTLVIYVSVPLIFCGIAILLTVKANWPSFVAPGGNWNGTLTPSWADASAWNEKKSFSITDDVIRILVLAMGWGVLMSWEGFQKLTGTSINTHDWYDGLEVKINKFFKNLKKKKKIKKRSTDHLGP